MSLKYCNALLALRYWTSLALGDRRPTARVMTDRQTHGKCHRVAMDTHVSVFKPLPRRRVANTSTSLGRRIGSTSRKLCDT